MCFKKKNKSKGSVESRNAGSRYETQKAAFGYWMTRMGSEARQTPFVMYIMPSVQAGWDALAELPFMEKATDTGKLITGRLAQYGSYAYEDGGCEAFITADDITKEEFENAAKVFEAHGGKLKNKAMPKGPVNIGSEPIKPVKKKGIEHASGSTYEVYTAPNRASAIEFLRDHPVTQSFYYIIVETPGKNYGRDINGLFIEE